jgi:septal ring factor EnvC (AmiA/AmiB activator)
MASIKKLKKDIDYLFFELISDCFMFTSLHSGEKRDQVHDLIEEAVSMRDEFIARVNHPDGKDHSEQAKAYYSALHKELIEKVDSYFKRLSEITKSK